MAAIVGIPLMSLVVVFTVLRLYRINSQGTIGLFVLIALGGVGGFAFYLGRTHARRARERRKPPPP